MKKLFIPFLFILVTSSGTLPSSRSVIYHSIASEIVTITLSNDVTCKEVISCEGGYIQQLNADIDSISPGGTAIGGKEFGKTNTRVLTIQTHGNDIYGWSDGNVTYTIK